MSCVISIGNFDGVHLGHRKLIGRMMEIAAERQLPAVVISYVTHPAYTLKKDARSLLLMPTIRKVETLNALGVDRVELLTFDHTMSRTSAEDFLHGYLMPAFQPEVIVVGYDSHFGFQRRGTHEFLQEHSGQYGYSCEYVQPYLHSGQPVSSSRIRTLLTSGDIRNANILLGNPYTLFGTIKTGRGMGRQLSFPTANLALQDPHQLIPIQGIYLSRMLVRGEKFFGLTNIGVSPTVKSDGVLEVETYLLDFSADIYGEAVQVELLDYIREEKMFETKELLISAMRQDMATARNLLGSVQC